MFRCHQRAYRDITVEGAAGADTYQIETSMGVFRCALLEVNVGGGVEFGHHYVDIVATHACRKCSKTMPVVLACDGVHFAVVRLMFNAVEDFFEHLYTTRVSNQYDIVGKGVSCEVYVVEASVGSQNQFA